MELELDILTDDQLRDLSLHLSKLRAATNAEYMSDKAKMQKNFDINCSVEESNYLRAAQEKVREAERERIELLKKYGKEHQTTRQIMNAIHSFGMKDLEAAYEKCRVANRLLDEKINEVDEYMDKKRADFRLTRMNIDQEHKASLEVITQLQVSIGKEQLMRTLMKDVKTPSAW